MKARNILFAASLIALSLDVAAQTPSPDELQHCLQHAERALALEALELTPASGEKFALGKGRHMIALNAGIARDGIAINPRLYCTLESDGEVSLVQSMPRLPPRAATTVVAK